MILSGFSCNPMQYVGQTASNNMKRKNGMDKRKRMLSQARRPACTNHGHKKDGHTAKSISGAGVHSHGCQATPPDDKKNEQINNMKSVYLKPPRLSKNIVSFRFSLRFSFHFSFLGCFIFHCPFSVHHPLFLTRKMPFWFFSCALDLRASRSHATNLLQPIANCWPVGAL